MSRSSQKDTILMLGKQLKVDVLELTQVCQKEEDEYNNFLSDNKGAKVSDILGQIKPYEDRLSQCYDTKVLPVLQQQYERSFTPKQE